MTLVRFGESGAAGDRFVAERMELEDRVGMRIRWSGGRGDWGMRSYGRSGRRE